MQSPAPPTPTSHADPHRIDDLASLEARYGSPSAQARNKVADRLSLAHRRWIERAGFAVLATVHSDAVDCSPRGDAPGQAFAVLDECTLALPDRPGNNRIDSLRHIVADPRVALLFLIRGEARVLRVRGRASVTTDPSLLERFRLDEALPITAVRIEIDAVAMQETRAVRRGGLFD